MRKERSRAAALLSGFKTAQLSKRLTPINRIINTTIIWPHSESRSSQLLQYQGKEQFANAIFLQYTQEIQVEAIDFTESNFAR